jgi:PAS domain-containing protein
VSAEGAAGRSRQSQTEEELRVAFEELQVLTEELEVANSSLHQTNQELDARVEERTRQIREDQCRTALDRGFVPHRRRSRPRSAVARGPARRGDVVQPALVRSDRAGCARSRRASAGWTRSIRSTEASRDSLGCAVASGTSYQHEHRIRDAEGNYRWFLVRAEPLRDGGRILHWFAAGTDIHDQRMAIEALQQSELRFRTLVEGMPQLAWRAADAGAWTWCSPQWIDYTGQDERSGAGHGLAARLSSGRSRSGASRLGSGA